MHQAANGEVCHDQPVKFLLHQVWCFATQYYFGAAQMGFEFVQCSFDFPPFMIQRRQFRSRCCFIIHNRCDQPIDRLSPLNALQSVLDYSDYNSVFTSSLVLLGTIDSAQVRTVGKPLFTRQATVFIHSPKQITTSATRMVPKVEPGKIAVGKTKHSLAQRRNYFLGKSDLPRVDGSHPGSKQDMCPVLDQGHETQLWKGTGSPASRRPSKSFLIFLLIGYIKRAAIQTYQTPFSVPSTFRGFHGNRPYN